MRYVVGSWFAILALAGCTGGRGPSIPVNQGVQVGNGMQSTQANFKSAHGFAVQFDSKLTISELPGRKTIRIDDTKINPSRVSSVEVTYLDNLGIDNEHELALMAARKHPGVNFKTVHNADLIEKTAELVHDDQVMQIRYVLAKNSKRTIGAEMRATKATAGVFAQILESLQVDTQAPDIKGVHWTPEFLAGEYAEIRVQADESISGVKNIRAVFRRTSLSPWRATERFVLEGEAQALDKSGEYRLIARVPPHIISGRYLLAELKAIDGAANEGTFDLTKRGADFTVFVNGSASEDHNRPEILEVKMPENVHVGSLNRIFFRARDQESGILTGKDVPVRVVLVNSSGSNQVEIRSATVIQTGNQQGYVLEFDLSRWVRSGLYSLSQLQIRDLAGNSNEVLLKGDRYLTYLIDGMTQKELEISRQAGGALGVAISGYSVAQAYPRVSSAAFRQLRYRPGQVARLDFSVSRPLTEDVRAVVNVRTRGKSDIALLKPARALPIHRDGDRYFVEFEINPWAELGFYHLEGLELQAGPTFRAIKLDGVTWENASVGGDGSPPSREPRFQQPGFTVE